MVRQAILNHEELITEISKAISRIGDMLPRTELHSELYPTERMREAVALLYAQIIEFALMAVRWVDELANAASKAEIRDQHAKVHNLERRMSQLMELMIGMYCTFCLGYLHVDVYEAG